MMQTLESKREGLLRYKVTREFIAYISQGLTPVYIVEGADVVADPDSWARWKWNGRESLQFFFGTETILCRQKDVSRFHSSS